MLKTDRYFCFLLFLIQVWGCAGLKIHGLKFHEPNLATRKVALKEIANSLFGIGLIPLEASSRCLNLEQCREIGDKKVAEQEAKNPRTRLSNGVRYKVIKVGSGDEAVSVLSECEINYSVSLASGSYMYSQGFGFEKGENGINTYKIRMGKHDVPVGIEEALIGMRRGETRRIELPPVVGLSTSNWKPEPTTQRGKATIIGYKQVLNGNGSSQPPFPAETIWDIEVVRIRKQQSS